MEIPFNFWNVMEYSLGFFGGAGMAYGTYTSTWESTEPTQKKASNLIPILLVVLFIPFVVWQQTFTIERIHKNYENLVDGSAETAAWMVQILALLLILGQTAFVLVKYHFSKNNELVQYSMKDVKLFLSTHFAIYTIFSLLITGAIVSTYRIEQYLYLVNYAVILFVLPKLNPVFDPMEINKNKWARNFLLVLIILAVLALIAINIHGEMNGAQKRFDF
jgi:magnesium-transporting ATPase (P-type)